jgi:hypothetical protein
MHELREHYGKFYFIPFDLIDRFDFMVQNSWMTPLISEDEFAEFEIEESVAQRILEEEEVYA